jgi:hypothetical protein
MLKDSTLQIIRESLGQLSQPVKLILFTSDTNCDSCPDAIAIARAIKAASPKIGLEMYDITMDRDKSGEYGVKRVPSFVVEGQDGKQVTFSGSLEGITLIMLLDALACIGTCRIVFPEKIVRTLDLLKNDVPIQVLLENDCSLCQPVAETAIGLALTNKRVATEIVVADDYPELLSKLRVKILPYTLFSPRLHLEGHVNESMFLEMLFQAEGQRASASDKRCVVCGSQSPDLICTNCRTKIQAEAVGHKRKDEKLHDKGTIVEHRKHS